LTPRRLAIALAILVAIPVSAWLLYPLLGVFDGTRVAADDATLMRRHMPDGWTVSSGLAHVSRGGRLGLTLTVSYSVKASPIDYPRLSQAITNTYTFTQSPHPNIWWDGSAWDYALPASFVRLPPVRRGALASYIVGLGDPFVWDARSMTGPDVKELHDWGGDDQFDAALRIAEGKGYRPADLLWLEPYLRGDRYWRSAQLLGWDPVARRWTLLAHKDDEFESPFVQD
jgi:hypothetical protein